LQLVKLKMLLPAKRMQQSLLLLTWNIHAPLSILHSCWWVSLALDWLAHDRQHDRYDRMKGNISALIACVHAQRSQAIKQAVYLVYIHI